MICQTYHHVTLIKLVINMCLINLSKSHDGRSDISWEISINTMYGVHENPYSSSSKINGTIGFEVSGLSLATLFPTTKFDVWSGVYHDRMIGIWRKMGRKLKSYQLCNAGKSLRVGKMSWDTQIWAREKLQLAVVFPNSNLGFELFQ